MTTPSRVKSPCQRCHRRRRLFRSLSSRLCLVLAPFAACPWTTNRQSTPRRSRRRARRRRDASPAVEEPQPGIPIVHCSQYRMEPLSYPTPLAAQRKDQYISDSDSEYGRLRLRRRRSPRATLIKHRVLHVHKDYEGLLLLCYHDTGLLEGGGYACFSMRDML